MFHLMRFRRHSRGYFMEAVSGVDIALWDVVGKALNLPVHRLMLGCNRAAAIPNLLIYEHMVEDNPLVDALFFEPLPRPKNGVIAIPKGPGLGIKVDPKALEKFRIP
jgi:L-alanine-DL-glutamate epimerase-like enolase superfamily enzyme